VLLRRHHHHDDDFVYDDGADEDTAEQQQDADVWDPTGDDGSERQGLESDQQARRLQALRLVHCALFGPLLVCMSAPT
jgi:hypothetical protein